MKSPLAISPAEVAVGLLITAGLIVGAIESPRQQEGSYESDLWTAQKIEHSEKSMAAFTGDMLPRKGITPGAFFREATLEKIKQPNYEKTIRHVTEADKKRVCQMYGVPWEKRDDYEFDHDIPASLGGATEGNIWPQPRAGLWNAAVKDRLERELLRQVRAGQFDLADARREIAENWITLYKKIFGPEPKAELIEDSEQ